MDVGKTEPEMNFLVLDKEILSQWRSLLETHHGVPSQQIYTFGNDGNDLDFTIITKPPTQLHDPKEYPGNNYAFIVSSTIVHKWFPTLRNVLAGVSKTTEEGSVGCVQLSMTHHQEFRIFLGLAHGCPVEFRCTPDILSKLAVFCKSQQLEAIAAPVVPSWIKAAQSTRTINVNPRGYDWDWDWLIIGYELGEEQIFHRAYYRLTFIVENAADEFAPVIGKTVSFGIYDRIHECRFKFLEYATRDIVSYSEQLLEAREHNEALGREICESGDQDCLKAQCNALAAWFEMKTISLDPGELEIDIWEFCGPPCDLFDPEPLDFSGMCEACAHGPLPRLLSKLEAEGMSVIGEFISLSADHCPMTKEHRAHMAGRKRAFKDARISHK